MGLSFRKKMGLSSQILAVVEESLALQAKYDEMATQWLDVSRELGAATKRLLELHTKLTAESKTPDELEVTDGSIIQVVTTHGTHIVGSECPQHKRVHNSHGWYICVDEGFVNVYGWYPNTKNS